MVNGAGLRVAETLEGRRRPVIDGFLSFSVFLLP